MKPTDRPTFTSIANILETSLHEEAFAEMREPAEYLLPENPYGSEIRDIPGELERQVYPSEEGNSCQQYDEAKVHLLSSTSLSDGKK